MNSPPAALEDGPDRGRLPPPAAGESTLNAQGDAGSRLHVEEHTGSKTKKNRHTRDRRPQQKRRLIEKRKKAYSELLDHAAQDSATTTSYGANAAAPLRESHIGASLWTKSEKELLFSALARCGNHDLPVLAKHVGSKSETEVRSYLLTLEAALEPTSPTNDSKKYILRSEVPAAYEVGEDCEKALDVAADVALLADCEEQALAERTKYRDAYLIDLEAATTIDEVLEQTPDTPDGTSDTAKLVTGPTKFFDAAMLLQLSQNVFMNGSPDGHWNYHSADLVEIPEGDTESGGGDEADSGSTPPGPAIFQSALSELYEIAQTVTQKLVHATLFQATSRLRAKDGTSPSPVVMASDVHAATDILALDLDWKSYWAKLPRRAGLEVYSDSKKYKSGRAGTKNGVKLTYEEVEAELGLPVLAQQPRVESKSLPDRLGSSEELSGESDSGLASEASDSDVSSDGIVDAKLENERRKRKRGLSPDSFARAEERHMQALDAEADRAEDERLRELLGLEALPRDHENEADIPERPRLRKDMRKKTRIDWRGDADPRAGWEEAYIARLRAEQERLSDDESASGDGQSDESLSSDDELASNA